MAILHTEPSAIDELTRYYTFENEALVREFIRARPRLESVLQEAVPHVYAAFGPDTPIILEVDWDDEECEPPELFAEIVTDKPALEALSALHRFDRSWWLHVDGLADLDLMFTIRSVRLSTRV